ncbi:transposable element [Tanacetum coccineum]
MIQIFIEQSKTLNVASQQSSLGKINFSTKEFYLVFLRRGIDEYASEYKNDPDFHRAIEDIKWSVPTEFTWQGKLLYKGVSLCIPKMGDRVRWMREAHTSKVAGHFGVTKTLQNLQRYVFWPRMHQDVAQFVKGGLPRTRKRNDYLFVVVDRFSKMVVLIPCKKTITGEEAARLFFKHVWKIFDLPTSIISDRDSRFLSNFWCSLWAKMDTNLKRSTAFHP